MGSDLSTEDEAMKCAICKQGAARAGRTTVTLERDDTVLVIKNVPAEICDNCGEAYVSDEVGAGLLEMIETAARQGVAVDVRQYAA